MNLTCPSCDTTFRIDPDLIGAKGRRVRCGSCGHDWVQAPPAEEAPAAAPEAAAPAEPEAPPPAAEETVKLRQAISAPGRGPSRRPPEPRDSPGRGRIAAGWLIFLLVLGGLVAGGYFGREQITATVPAAGDLYRRIGLAVEAPPGEGLELREIKSARRLIDGQRVVVIEGLVANVSDQPRNVPRLRASVTDNSGAQVDEWVFSAKASNLPPGGVTEFETSTRNAPSEGSLGIEFVASR